MELAAAYAGETHLLAAMKVQEYMTRLSDTERQAAKHKLIASRAQQNQAQAERDVEGLRCHPPPTDIAANYLLSSVYMLA